MLKTLPNMLTMLRIILIPIFVIVFYLPFKGAHFTAAVLFGLACATDWLDGYLARRLKQTSRFGAFLDPVADKLIVATALVMVVAVPWLSYLTIPAAIIIGREIVISALREWMAEIGQRTTVAVANIAKWKTALQMIGIGFLVWYTPNASPIIVIIGYVTLYFATVLTLWTMIAYLYASRKAFEE